MKLETIKEVVEFDSGCKDITEQSRKGNLPALRGMYMVLARKHTIHTLAEIGSFVNKDHASVLHWEKNLKHFIRFDKNLKELFLKIEHRLLTISKSDLSKLMDFQAEQVINQMPV